MDGDSSEDSKSWDRGGRRDRNLTLHDLCQVVQTNRRRPIGRRRAGLNAGVFF